MYAAITLKSRAAFVAFILLLLAACRQTPIAATDLQLHISASDRLVGETTIRVTVQDADGNAIADPGALQVRGDMRHAGMKPVFAQADQASDGVFNLPFEWTMAGAWIVEARLTLPNGDVAAQNFNFEIGLTADNDVANMDHSAMTGDSSAVYMRILNQGESDRVLISAESAAAAQIDFHRTIVEDDMARMEAVEALVILAGKTLELRPGGTHIMLRRLTEDLRPDAGFSLTLKSETGESYALDIRIANMLMSDLDDAVDFGDLVFSHRWARPAKAKS